jgi:tetratricopeptide (TPR) repeat protein
MHPSWRRPAEFSSLRTRVFVFSVSLSLCGFFVTVPRPDTALAQARGPLGKISFPNSGAAAAQADFIRGVLWLHNFGYEEAIDAFRAAQKIDPAFAMAYWGEAMAFNQPLWFHEDVAAGQAALVKLGPTPQARAVKAKTPREQAYLAAVDALFAAGVTKAARDKSYADRMAALAQQFPTDDEAKVFHALALLAILPRGDQALPLRKQAGAIAEEVFARNPQHPGAPHYILHAYDDATLAARAVPAARAYAKIAPASSHALHMPSHAFLQLGYWSEAAASDQASWDASVAWASSRSLSVAMRDFHSLTWLQYEWTQQGRFAKASEALRLVDEALKAVGSGGAIGGHHYGDSEIGRGSGPATLRNDRGSMYARYVIESERWGEMKGQGSFDNVDELFALGMSAYKLGDRGRLTAAVGEFEKMSTGTDGALREQAAVMLHELGALLLLSDGQKGEAFAAMDRAVAAQGRQPRPIGRPYPVKGADELYGELLLSDGRAKEAVAWFERALTRTPNRSRAVLGLARAAAKSGDGVKSRGAFKQFLANWAAADAGQPEMAEARAALGAARPQIEREQSR